MNKYSKLTNLSILIALLFTSFFLWKAQAVSPNPKVNIVTIEGNAEYLKPIELYGDISNNQVYGNHPILTLRDNKIEYLEDQPITKQIDGSLNASIDRLITDYRSFMRGKTRQANRYITTDDWVVYTALATDIYWQDSVENELIISILNRETEEEREFTINLGEQVNYFNLHTTQLNYPELSIAMTIYNTNGNAEHIISTFDFENPEANLSEKINFSDKLKDDEFVYAGNIFDKSGRFIPFQSVRITQTMDDQYDGMNTESREVTSFFVYDIEKRKFIDIPLFEENKTHVFVDQNRIYVVEDLGETLTFYEMDLESEELKAPIDIQMASPSMGRDLLHSYNEFFNQNIAVVNGKLYAYERQQFKEAYLPVFQVIDLEENENVFLGRLDASNDAKLDAPTIDIFEFQLNPTLK